MTKANIVDYIASFETLAPRLLALLVLGTERMLVPPRFNGLGLLALEVPLAIRARATSAKTIR